MISSPAISICIPFYQGAAFVEETVRSVLAQTYADWELVMTDDASTDRTAEAVEALMARVNDPRLRFYRNAERLGMAENWNKVVGLARGRYVKLVCGDDLLRPDCLERQAQALDTHPTAALVGASRQVVSAQGRPLFVRACYKRSGLYPGDEAIRKSLLAGTNTIGDPVAVMFRAELLQKSGLFEPTVVYYTDIDLWLRLLLHGDLYFIHEPLAFYRIHKASTGTNLRNEAVSDFQRVVERLEARGGPRFSNAQRKWIAVQSQVKSWLRRMVYVFLAQR